MAHAATANAISRPASWIIPPLAIMAAAWLTTSAMAQTLPFDPRPLDQQTSPLDAAPEEPKSKPAAKEKSEAKAVADIEVVIPSITRLVSAARESCTGRLVSQFSALAQIAPSETGEGMDVDAAMQVFEQIKSWPDTAIDLTVYKRDSDGRPRWVIRVDWPLEQLRKRVDTLIRGEAAGKVIGKLTLTQRDGVWRLELPDVLLGVLADDGDGSMFRSSPDLKPASSKLKSSLQKLAEKERPLVVCRQALDVMGINDLRYEGFITKDGRWNEVVKVGWNPLLGLGIKTQVKRVASPYSVPRDAFAAAAFNAAGVDGLADAMIGLPKGTIGDKASSDMSVAVLPGTGFVPVPDLVMQFTARDMEKIITAMRGAVQKDSDTRGEDDRPPAWRENKEGDCVFFWQDPASREGGGITPFNMKTVVFVDSASDSGKSGRLIIAQTSTRADDMVRRWRKLARSEKLMSNIPSSADAHWQARIRWPELYAHAHPWVSMLAAFASAAALPPTVAELGDGLSDSVLDVKIEFSGLKVNHQGPVPLGAAYVPIAIAAAVDADESFDSESMRERVAIENLRVLQHHAVLFRKDFNRWPSRVSELDGYIDFWTNRHLLNLQPKSEGMMEQIKKAIEKRNAAKDKKPETEVQAEPDDINDSLYQIELDGDKWLLKVRPDEFKQLKTITIDAAGNLNRVKKKS